MNSGNRLLSDEIRQWLVEHPLKDDEELDVHGVPAFLFDLAVDDPRLIQLNRQIKGLTLQQQKLLLYLSRDFEPALIIESMEYASPELFWLDKALLIKEVDPTARQPDVQQVFAINQSILDEIYSMSDQIEDEEIVAKEKKYRKWLLIASPIVLLLAFLFLYPLFFKPDSVSLFDQYKNSYQPDLKSIDTAGYAGGSYFEALLLMKESNFSDAARLFEEVIPADSTLRTGSRWFLALINLQRGDKASCIEQLRAIKGEDPPFYDRVAGKLYRSINR
jgi:hypothetical protein